MILVVGACVSGKRTYALSCGYATEEMIDIASLGGAEASNHFVEELCQMDGAVVCNAHLLAKCDCDIDFLTDILSSKDMVLCTEVGAGVVPVNKEDREFRERAGRLSVELADHADKVIRMICGIPVTLKG